MSFPLFVSKLKAYWKYYLVPTSVNLLGVAYLFWSQESSINLGQSDWGYIVPIGSYYILAPLSFIAYVLVFAFIRIDINQKNT